MKTKNCPINTEVMAQLLRYLPRKPEKLDWILRTQVKMAGMVFVSPELGAGRQEALWSSLSSLMGELQTNKRP